MSGDNQHYLPQHVQRGFAAQRKGRITRVWFYRGEGAPRLTPTNNIGARRRFYSADGAPGAQSLDWRMTHYENGRFDTVLRALRAAPIGEPVPAQDAAELISHLVFRNAHVRDSMSVAARRLATTAVDWSEDPERIRRMLGLDAVRPTARFREHIRSAFAKPGRLDVLPVPVDALDDVAFSLVREKFGGLWSDTRSGMRTWAIGLLGASQGSIMTEIHNEALDKGFHPEGIQTRLSTLAWSIIKADQSVILPDCVALSFNAEGEAAPLMMSADRPLVIMALCADRFLVGRAPDAPEPPLFLWNLHAAACSLEFFVAAVDTEDLRQYSRYIGVRTYAGIDDSLGSAMRDLDARMAEEASVPAQLAPAFATVSPSASDGRVGVTFKDMDEDDVRAISPALSELIGDHLDRDDLGRLDGITFAGDFAGDFAGAARALDRGVPGAALEPGGISYGAQVSLTPLVLRSGVVQTHLLFRAEIGRALIASDPIVRSMARHVIVSGLAWVKVLRMREAAFPGVTTFVLEDQLDHQRFGPASAGWQAYFSGRLAASAWTDADTQHRSLLLSALEMLRTTLPKRRLDYRFHGDAGRLATEALALAGEVLIHAGAWLGHRDEIGREPLPETDVELAQRLREADLVDWFDLYRRDLETFWNRRDTWTSFDEVLIFNLHVDRLIWPHGLIFSRTSDRQPWLYVPLASDRAQLPGEAIKRGLKGLRDWIARRLSGPASTDRLTKLTR